MSEIVARQVDGITVLDVTKSFMEIERNSEQRGELQQLVAESLDSGHNKILLNMSQVVYCSNTAFAEVIAALKTIRNRGGHLKLSSVPPSVRAQMELTHTLKIFDIYDDEAAAVQSFQPAPSKTIQLAVREVSGITVLDIPEAIMEISRTSEQRGKLLNLVHESLARGRKNIVLNLSQVVGYGTHTALGELVAAFTSIRNQGGHLKLSNVPPNFRAALELTHLLPIFDIYADEAAAIQSFKST